MLELLDAAVGPVPDHQEAATVRPERDDRADGGLPQVHTCPIAGAQTTHGTPPDVFVPRGSAKVTKDSIILCNQVRMVDKERIRSPRIGTVDPETLALVDCGLRAILDL